MACELRAGSVQELDHRDVLLQHDPVESGDADVCGAVGEGAQQNGAESTPLEVVDHRQGDLGRCRIVVTDVARHGDEPLPVAVGRDDGPGEAVEVVQIGEDIEVCGEELGQRTEEALIARPPLSSG